LVCEFASWTAWGLLFSRVWLASTDCLYWGDLALAALIPAVTAESALSVVPIVVSTCLEVGGLFMLFFRGKGAFF